MNTSFGLDAVALGLVASAIGGAEFVSAIVCGGICGPYRKMADGGRRPGVGGRSRICCLPFFGRTALLGTVGLVALCFLSFELAIVAALPLITEIAPNARATLLSLGVAGFSLGRAAGSFTGPALYANFGFGATSLGFGGRFCRMCDLVFLGARTTARGCFRRERTNITILRLKVSLVSAKRLWRVC